MDLGVIERWQHSEEVELFYNATERKLVFKKHRFIYSKGVDDLASYPYLDWILMELPIHPLCSLLMTLSSVLEGHRLNCEFYIGINELWKYKAFCITVREERGLGVPLTGDKAMYCDFVVVSIIGVNFFKCSMSNLQLSCVKNYKGSIGHYWYDSVHGVITTASSPPKLGECSAYFLHQNKGAKHFNGEVFRIDVSPSVTDQWTTSLANGKNMMKIKGSYGASDPHRIGLVCLYTHTYCVIDREYGCVSN